MPIRSAKIFSLRQANELLTLVADATTVAVKRLDDICRQHKVDFNREELVVSESVITEIEHALQEWSDYIRKLGAYPKGYFNVDFQSIDPELLYCWTYGEDKISFIHKVWEHFDHRRPLADSFSSSANPVKWLN